MSPQVGRDETSSQFDTKTQIFFVEVGTPIGDRLTAYASFDFTSVEAGMDPWHFEGVFPEPVVDDLGNIVFDLADEEDAEFLDREAFGIVYDYSNVDVVRRDLTLGLRAKLGGGWGAETMWVYTNYGDSGPILEDETGEYSRISFLLSRSF